MGSMEGRNRKIVAEMACELWLEHTMEEMTAELSR